MLDAVVVAKEHRSVQRDRQDEPDEVLSGESRIVDVEMPLIGQSGERGGECVDHRGQSRVVKRSPERGKAGGLADDKASELEPGRVAHR